MDDKPIAHGGFANNSMIADDERSAIIESASQLFDEPSELGIIISLTVTKLVVSGKRILAWLHNRAQQEP
ncbi:hypothetical protein N9O24_00340 [bacterium]|nr:hypothetical protein [bacterium]